MPTINVTERKVSPRLDRGLLAGLIAGGVVFIWTFIVGTLSAVGAASMPVFLSSLALGPDVFDKVGFNGNWLIGTVMFFCLFTLIGILFAAVWPSIRKYGTWTPALLFSLAVYLVFFQVLGRIIQPGMAAHLNDFGLITGFILAGFAFAYRYRHG